MMGQETPTATPFSLGLTLMILFFATGIAHLIAEWQVFTDEQWAVGVATISQESRRSSVLRT